MVLALFSEPPFEVRPSTCCVALKQRRSGLRWRGVSQVQRGWRDERKWLQVTCPGRASLHSPLHPTRSSAIVPAGLASTQSLYKYFQTANFLPAAEWLASCQGARSADSQGGIDEGIVVTRWWPRADRQPLLRSFRVPASSSQFFLHSFAVLKHNQVRSVPVSSPPEIKFFSVRTVPQGVLFIRGKMWRDFCDEDHIPSTSGLLDRLHSLRG